MKKRGAIVIVSLLFAGLFACGEKSITYGPGVRAPAAPVQTSIADTELRVDDYVLTERADFSLTGKLLAKRRYRWDDLAGVAPWDFAVAWGALSDEVILAETRLVQGGRLMYWHLYDSPLPLTEVERSSANLHLIPGSEAIGEQLAAVPRGAIVTVRGRLVDVRLPDGKTIPTSLSRFDTGVGACEILKVEAVTWERPAS